MKKIAFFLSILLIFFCCSSVSVMAATPSDYNVEQFSAKLPYWTIARYYAKDIDGTYSGYIYLNYLKKSNINIYFDYVQGTALYCYVTTTSASSSDYFYTLGHTGNSVKEGYISRYMQGGAQYCLVSLDGLSSGSSAGTEIDLEILYSDCNVYDWSGNLLHLADNKDSTIVAIENSTSQIIDATDAAAEAVTDKLDSVYYGDYPYNAPEVDTGAQDDLSDIESSLLASAQVDTSIFDNAQNFDKSGIPFVGQLMTKIIDLGFGNIVVFCLSVGLGLAVLGKRFG